MSDEVVVRLGDIENAIFEGIEDNRELRDALDDFVDAVHTTWVNIWVASGPHPYTDGEYLAHIKKQKMSKYYRQHVRNFLRRHQGMPIGMVFNDSENSVFVEYGTGPDKPGGHSPWGPNTPTPEFAPMRKTYARYLA